MRTSSNFEGSSSSQMASFWHLPSSSPRASRICALTAGDCAIAATMDVVVWGVRESISYYNVVLCLAASLRYAWLIMEDVWCWFALAISCCTYSSDAFETELS